MPTAISVPIAAETRIAQTATGDAGPSSISLPVTPLTRSRYCRAISSATGSPVSSSPGAQLASTVVAGWTRRLGTLSRM